MCNERTDVCKSANKMINMEREWLVVYLHTVLVIFQVAVCCSVIPRTIPAHRICKPGPLFPEPRRGKNCLIIGDSISIGYTRYVEKSLELLCQVQHAPFDFSYGGALDSEYGVKCLHLWLKTLAQDSTRYDAIVFNFGLHDVCCFIGPREELVSPPKYYQNLKTIKNVLLSTGSSVGYILTTPVPFSKSKNSQVSRYNELAQGVMSQKPTVPVLDLYKKVVDKCGHPPYSNCSISLKGFGNPHYNVIGDKYLGNAVSGFFQSLLLHQKQPGMRSKLFKLNAFHRAQARYITNKPVINCTNESGNTVGVCPIDSTCSPQAHSVTGSGCCLLPDAVLCTDSYHCCPRGWACDPLCSQTLCRCGRRETE